MRSEIIGTFQPFHTYELVSGDVTLSSLPTTAWVAPGEPRIWRSAPAIETPDPLRAGPRESARNADRFVAHPRSPIPAVSVTSTSCVPGLSSRTERLEGSPTFKRPHVIAISNVRPVSDTIHSACGS